MEFPAGLLGSLNQATGRFLILPSDVTCPVPIAGRLQEYAAQLDDRCLSCSGYYSSVSSRVNEFSISSPGILKKDPDCQSPGTGS